MERKLTARIGWLGALLLLSPVYKPIKCIVGYIMIYIYIHIDYAIVYGQPIVVDQLIDMGKPLANARRMSEDGGINCDCSLSIRNYDPNRLCIYRVLIGGLEYFFPFSWEFHDPQLTSSYFSEGWLNHQADYRFR